MTALVVITAVIAGLSTIVLAKAVYTVRRAAIAEGIAQDIIDPQDSQRYIVSGSVAARWPVVTFVVAVAGFATAFGAWNSLQGNLADEWNLFIIAAGQLFGWGFAPLFRQENIRARAEHQRYLKLYGDQTVT